MKSLEPLFLEATHAFEEGLTAAINEEMICISVSEEKAVDSYNERFECTLHLTKDQVISLKTWLDDAINNLYPQNMSNQLDILPKPIKPRKKREWLMHVYDAGDGSDGFEMACCFECTHCGYKEEWVNMRTVTEAKRGIPCPKCNH